MIKARDPGLVNVDLAVEPQSARTYIGNLQDRFWLNLILNARIKLLEIRISIVAVRK